TWAESRSRSQALWRRFRGAAPAAEIAAVLLAGADDAAVVLERAAKSVGDLDLGHEAEPLARERGVERVALNLTRARRRKLGLERYLAQAELAAERAQRVHQLEHRGLH